MQYRDDDARFELLLLEFAVLFVVLMQIAIQHLEDRPQRNRHAAAHAEISFSRQNRQLLIERCGRYRARGHNQGEEGIAFASARGRRGRHHYRHARWIDIYRPAANHIKMAYQGFQIKRHLHFIASSTG